MHWPQAANEKGKSYEHNYVCLLYVSNVQGKLCSPKRVPHSLRLYLEMEKLLDTGD